MRNLLIIFMFIVSVGQIQAQSKMVAMSPSGKITGLILDSLAQKPIEFATISVLSTRDSSLVTGTISNEKGEFLIEQVPFGGYVVQIHFIGYKTQKLAPIALLPENPVLNLGTVSLAVAAENLATVEVTADQPMMQLAPDRKIFNVEKTALAKGGNAIDVLRNTPTLNVDMDGNVTLRGSQGVNILINNKPTALMGGNRKAMLQQIPASMIERIEIITNPSAKYDPDGVSGIINIVLKKNKMQGFSGNITGSIGSIFNKYDFSAGISYKTSKFNVYANYSFNYNDRYNYSNSFRTNYFAHDTTSFDQKDKGNRIQYGHFAKVGLDYYLSEASTLSASASFNPNAGGSNTLNDYCYLDVNQELTGMSQRKTTNTANRLAMDYNLNYTWRNVKNPEHTFVADATFSKNDATEKNIYFQQNYDKEGIEIDPATPLFQRNPSINNSTVFSGQLDYTRPFKKAGKLETGVKSTIRNIDNNFVWEDFNYNQGQFTNNAGYTNNFQYREQVHAMYATYGQTIKKFNFQAGLRLEQALTKSTLVTTNQEFINNYFSAYPSAHVGYELPKQQSIQLAYSRRVQRPFLSMLNPFAAYNDPFSIRKGNPFLRPEYTHSTELNYTKYLKKSTFIASIYMMNTTNVFRRIFSVDSTGLGTVTYNNFNNANAYGIELVYSGQLTKWWRVNASVNGYRMEENGTNVDSNFTNKAFWGHLSLYSSFNITKRFTAEVNFFWQSPLKLVLGYAYPGTWSSIALSHTFLKDKLTVTLRTEDPMYLQKFRYDLHNTTFHTKGTYRWESRVVFLSVSYNFGKMDMQTRRKLQRKNSGDNSGGVGM